MINQKKKKIISELFALFFLFLIVSKPLEGFAVNAGNGTATFSYLAASSLPIINGGSPITVGTASVILAGNSGAQITINLIATDGKTILDSITTYLDSKGTYAYNPSLSLIKGESITAVQTTPGNGPSQTAIQPVVPADLINKPSNPPTINQITAGDTRISGKADSSASTITITLPNGLVEQVTASQSPDSEGFYDWTLSVPTSQMVLSVNQTVSATQTNLPTDEYLYSISTTTNITVIADDTPQLPNPVFNQVFVGDKLISGKGTPGSTITVTFSDQSTFTALVDNNGLWTLTVPNNVNLSFNDLLSAQSSETGYKPSNIVTTKVLIKQTSWILPFTGGDSYFLLLVIISLLALAILLLKLPDLKIKKH
jgi:hypothetical protein